MLTEPTMRLRWIEVDDGELSKINTCFGFTPKLYPETDPHYFKLQQMWIDSGGKKEWKDIEIEHSP